MTRLLFIRRMPIKTFYRRRISRILPAHLAFIAIVTLFLTFAEKKISIAEIIAAAIFVNNYFGNAVGQSVMPFGHIWSLSVEEHSYIILSLVAALCLRRTVPSFSCIAALTLLCIIFATTYASTFDGPKLNFELWIRTEVAAYGILLSGALLMVTELRGAAVLPGFGKSAVPTLLAIAVVAHWWSSPPLSQLMIGVSALAVAINILPYSHEAVKRFLSMQPLRLLGVWSFSLYLWQQPFYLSYHKGAMSLTTALLLTFVAGVGSHYCIEKPFRSYLNRTWARG